jgi:hypothetical protein
MVARRTLAHSPPAQQFTICAALTNGVRNIGQNVDTHGLETLKGGAPVNDDSDDAGADQRKKKHRNLRGIHASRARMLPINIDRAVVTAPEIRHRAYPREQSQS